MATAVESAEVNAKRALTRLAASVESGVAFAFTPDECRTITDLIDTLRDHLAVDSEASPFEKPCPVCKGERSDSDDPCDGCNGLRLIPTKVGRKILDLIERNFLTSADDDLWAPVNPPDEVDPLAANFPGALDA